MAKIYGQIQPNAIMTFDKSFSRMYGQPLDYTEVYSSLQDAQAYAATDAAYVGQKIVVIDEENGIVKHYGIEVDGSLKELGAATLGDNETIELDEGILALKNWGKEYYKWVDANGDDPEAEGYVAGHHEKYVMVEGDVWPAGLEPKAATTADGTVALAWYQPSNLTAEEVNTTVSSLKNTVDVLTEGIGNINDEASAGTVYGALNAVKAENAEINETLTTINDELSNKLDLEEGGTVKGALTVDNTLDVTGDMTVAGVLVLSDGYEAASKDYVDTTIATKIAEAGHLKREIVDALPDVDAEGVDDNTIYMIKTGLLDDKYVEYMLINGVFEQIGDTSVDLTNYTQKVENAVEGNLVGFGAEGILVDSGILYEDVADHITDKDLHIGETERATWNQGAALAASASTAAAAAQSTADDAKTAAEAAKTIIENLGLEALKADDFTKLAALPAITAIGGNLLLGEDGVLSAVAEQYELPAATAEELGGVKVGTGLAIDENGTLSVSVAGENGLAIVDNNITIALASESTAGAMSAALVTKLNTIESNAQANVIESVLLAGTEATVSNKQISIPFASATDAGLVIGVSKNNATGAEEKEFHNKIYVHKDEGIMEVSALSVEKLVVPEGVEFILNGGNAE